MTPPANPTERRLQLHAAGYLPIPVEGKIPVISGWQLKTNIDEADVTEWARRHSYARGTGLLCRHMPALDVDIKDSGAAEAVEALVSSRFEESGSVLTRIGQAPKRAILFRTAVPFKKITVNLIAPDGSTDQKIEVLGDGQQLVAFGKHPLTDKPYAWSGGQPGEVKWTELPYIEDKTARELVEDVVELLCSEHGYKRTGKDRQRVNGVADPFTEHAQSVCRDKAEDWEVVSRDIIDGTNLHDNICLLAAKLISSGMSGGAAVNAIRGLMKASSAPHDARWQDRYDDIVRAVETAEAKYGEAEAKAEASASWNTEAPSATPFSWIDPATIPPRRFLYDKHYIRQFSSTTLSLGGIGKSTLVIAEALAIATGKPLLGIKPEEKRRVWLWNGEDPLEELQRRIMAVALHYDLKREDFEGYLFVDSGRRMAIILAEQGRKGVVIAKPIIDAVIRTIMENGIDVLIIDPFVSSHRVTENDNSAIETVAKTWGNIANETNCAVELVHHTRKTGGAEITVEDGRGASALLNAVRSARVINLMSKAEGEKTGVENHRKYFRVDNGKANLAPPSDKADWYQLTSVGLGNGDNVGVVEPWKYPNPFDDITTKDLRAAQREVSKGGPWRASSQADDWVGVPIAIALKVDLTSKVHKEKIKGLLKVWTANGMFKVVGGKDNHRNKRSFVEVGQWATD